MAASSVRVPAAPQRTIAAPVSRLRVVVACVVALLLPPLLEVAVLALGPSLLAVDVLFQLAGVIAVALIGGLWPALLAALWSSIILNYTSTEPFGSLEIADTGNVVTVLIFITVAVAVSLVVGLSARRSREAALAQQEAALLGELARGVLAEEDTLQGFLRHVQTQFDADAVALFGPSDTATGDPAGTSREDDGARSVMTSTADGPDAPDAAPAPELKALAERPAGTEPNASVRRHRAGPARRNVADEGAEQRAREVPWALEAAAAVAPVDDGVTLALFGRSLSARDRGVLTAFAGQLRSIDRKSVV